MASLESCFIACFLAVDCFLSVDGTDIGVLAVAVVPAVAGISGVDGITAIADSTAVARITAFDGAPAVEYVVY